MLRRKVDNPDESAAETEVPEAAVPGAEDTTQEAAATPPDASVGEPEETAEVEPAGVLEEDIRDEQIEVTETPATPAEALVAASERAAPQAEPEQPAPQTPPGPGPLAARATQSRGRWTWTRFRRPRPTSSYRSSSHRPASPRTFLRSPRLVARPTAAPDVRLP